MEKTAALLATGLVIAGCYTGPTYTRKGQADDKVAMENAVQKCESFAKANCSPGGDSYNYCLKARTKQCMEGDGWTEK